MVTDRLAGWGRRHPLWVDAGIAALAGPMTLVGVVGSPRVGLPWWGALIFGAGFTVPIVLRRRAPDLGAAILVVSLLVQVVVADEFLPTDFAVPFVMYAVACYGRRSWRRWWLVAAYAGSAVAGWDWSVTNADGRSLLGAGIGAVFCAMTATAFYLWGAFTRQRRDTYAALRSRADSLERERDATARLAAQEERSRIAREMHDIVAHSLSVIVVQADGASYLAAQQDPSSPQAAALATIGDTARSALAETRRLVGVLRDGADAEYAPTAALTDVAALVERSAAAGLAVTLEVPDPLPGDGPLARGGAAVGRDAALAALGEGLGASAQAALYRVAQEGLTNVMKHGGPDAVATVALARTADGVRLAVRNTGALAARGDGAGHGLLGMRERVAAQGGSFEARPLLGGGFEVVAHVPTAPGGPPPPSGVPSDTPPTPPGAPGAAPQPR